MPLPYLYDSQDRSAIQQARDSMLVDTAEMKWLSRLGNNVGVPRPPQSPFDDDLYRNIVQILGWLPKTPLLVTWRLAETLFGTQAALILANGVAWQIYEVNPNEIIFECPIGLITGTPATATYLHGYPGFATAVSGPTNIITSQGTDASASIVSGNLIGQTLYIFYSSAYHTYTISGFSYSAGTNTFTLNASTVPTIGNTPFFIDIPASLSYDGDVLLADATIPADGITAPSSAVYLFGQAKLDIFTYYMNNFVRAAGVTLRTEVL